MTSFSSRFRPASCTPLTAVLTALMLAGCVAHRDEHAAVRQVSIKDQAEATVVRKAPAPVVKKTKVARGQVEKTEKEAAKIAMAPSAPASEKVVAEPTPAPVEKGRVKSAASEAEKPVVVSKPVTQQPEQNVSPSSANAAAGSPKVDAPAIKTINPPVVSIPPPPAVKVDVEKNSKPVTETVEKSSPQPTLVMPPREPAAVSAVETSRPIADARRSGTVVSANAPATAPTPPSVVVQQPVQVPAVEAAPKQQPVIAVQPKPKAPDAATDLPGQPKLAALSEDQRVRDTITRAHDHLLANRLINARALLQDAARGSNGELLMALAGTYDPVQLRQNYPKLVRSADPLRALELYQQAAQNGASASLARIEALRAATAIPVKQ